MDTLWKILTGLLVFYVLIWGMLMDVPAVDRIEESIRNLYYHVPMWFGMIFLFLGSAGFSIAYLSDNKFNHDIWASELARTGLVLGVLGMATGMIWAWVAWGAPWSNDPKQNTSAIALLIYLAYFVFRGAFKDRFTKAKFSSIYNIIAFFAIIPLIFVLPRMTESLHPGGEAGSPVFNPGEDLAPEMRWVFYPAIVGFTLLGLWLTQLRVRVRKLIEKNDA